MEVLPNAVPREREDNLETLTIHKLLSTYYHTLMVSVPLDLHSRYVHFRFSHYWVSSKTPFCIQRAITAFKENHIDRIRFWRQPIVQIPLSLFI